MATELETAADRIIAETDFSGVVSVSRAGSPLLERASGMADRAHGVVNTRATRFGIASGTKGFTALRIMSLVADGALRSDTPVRDVLGDALELIDPAVTVEHLLSHTSGIGDYMAEDDIADIEDFELPVPPGRLARTSDYLVVLRGHPSAFPAGERFVYNNSAFVVLALIAEAVGGSDFHDLVADRVFGPAGMTASAFPRSDELPGDAALGYVASDSGLRTNQLILPVRGSGDGGAYSTVGDIAAFWPALFAGRIVPRALVAEMVRPRHARPEEEKRYGLGFWLREDGDGAMLEGYDAGVSFRTVYDPASELMYVVMANTSEGAWPLVELLDERWPGLAR